MLFVARDLTNMRQADVFTKYVCATAQCCASSLYDHCQTLKIFLEVINLNLVAVFKAIFEDIFIWCVIDSMIYVYIFILKSLIPPADLLLYFVSKVNSEVIAWNNLWLWCAARLPQLSCIYCVIVYCVKLRKTAVQILLLLCGHEVNMKWHTQRGCAPLAPAVHLLASTHTRHRQSYNLLKILVGNL